MEYATTAQNAAPTPNSRQLNTYNNQDDKTEIATNGTRTVNGASFPTTNRAANSKNQATGG